MSGGVGWRILVNPVDDLVPCLLGSNIEVLMRKFDNILKLQDMQLLRIYFVAPFVSLVPTVGYLSVDGVSR